MRFYIAGKMRGVDDLNRAAFNTAARMLCGEGHTCFNPAANSLGADATWQDYMRFDIPELCKCDAIYMLDGWWWSPGARLEHEVAQACGLTVRYQDHV